MCHSLRFWLFASCVVAGAAAVCFLFPPGPGCPADEPSPSRSLYHTDPEHLWNRLHEALFVRVGHDGRTYGQDRLEPLLWRESKHLLGERSNKNAIALLEEFLKNKGEKLIDDPLKRALLQRDLWLVFNWLEGSHDNFAESVRTTPSARRCNPDSPQVLSENGLRRLFQGAPRFRIAGFYGTKRDKGGRLDLLSSSFNPQMGQADRGWEMRFQA